MLIAGLQHLCLRSAVAACAATNPCPCRSRAAMLLGRCDAPLLFLELDRILRPGGWLLFRERRRDRTLITKLAESMHWELKRYLNQSDEELHAFQKTYWRP